jgi:protoporphyrinogen/coproporphyrinogen III oxidase
MTHRVVVVGGGVSGLTTAYRLRQRDPSLDVAVLEATASTGGMCRSVEVGGLRVPAGPDAFLARKPWAVDLCKELGIELVEPRASGQYLWTSTGLVAYPSGTAFGIPGDLGDAFRWPGLSRRGRARALCDLFIPKRKGDADESLGSLLRRRLGDEATDRSLAPLLAGLYAGDVDDLSVQATFAELQDWERVQGSLLRGAQVSSRYGRRNPGGPMFMRPRDGVDALPGFLTGHLDGAVRTGASAISVTATADGWEIETSSGPVVADAVVLTQDAPSLAGILPPGRATNLLDEIPFVSTATVALVYPEGSADDLPDGSGFVAPRGAAPMTACTWLSRKWPDPDYGGRAVLTCSVGVAGEDDVLDAPDADLVGACARHLTALLPLPPTPEHAAVVRWPNAMPQYRVGHPDRARALREALPAGIFVTGRSLDGIGISDRVRAAGEVADAVDTYLAKEAVG